MEIETINGTQLKRGGQISTFDNKSRLQQFSIITSSVTTPRNQIFYIELDERYKYCTGIAIIDKELTIFNNKNNTISIADDYHNIFNPINTFFWTKNQKNIFKNDIFMPCFFKAKNNRISIKINHQGYSAGCQNYYFIFRLENNIQIPKFEYNFLQKYHIVPPNTYIMLEDISFDNSYSKIKGIQSLYMTDENNETKLILGTKELNYQGNIILNTISQHIIANSESLSYIDNFFPINFECQNKTITLKSDFKQATLGGLDQEFILFLLEKPFDDKYL